MYSRGVQLLRLISLVVLVFLGVLVLHDLAWADSFSSPSIISSCSLTPSSLAATLAAPLSQGRSGSQFGFTLTLQNPPQTNTQYGYEVWYSPSGVVNYSLDTRSQVALLTQSKTVTLSGLSTTVIWQVPAAAPAGQYALFPFAKSGSQISYGTPLHISLLSGYSAASLLPNNFVTDIPAHIVSSDTKIQYVVYLTNPDTTDHSLQVTWQATDPLSPGKTAQKISQVITVPAHTAQVEASQEFNRHGFAFLDITTSTNDSGFITSSTNEVSGTLPPHLAILPQGVTETDGLIDQVNASFCLPLYGANNVLPADFSVGTTSYNLTQATYQNEAITVTQNHFILPAFFPVKVSITQPDGSTYQLKYSISNSRMVMGRFILTLFLLMAAVVILVLTRKKKMTYQEPL